jgi:hypothetical protein
MGFFIFYVQEESFSQSIREERIPKTFLTSSKEENSTQPLPQKPAYPAGRFYKLLI